VSDPDCLVPQAGDLLRAIDRPPAALERRLLRLYLDNPFLDEDAVSLALRLNAPPDRVAEALGWLCRGGLLQPVGIRGYMLSPAGIGLKAEGRAEEARGVEAGAGSPGAPSGEPALQPVTAEPDARAASEAAGPDGARASLGRGGTAGDSWQAQVRDRLAAALRVVDAALRDPSPRALRAACSALADVERILGAGPGVEPGGAAPQTQAMT